jgi:hypothetical protein
MKAAAVETMSAAAAKSGTVGSMSAAADVEMATAVRAAAVGATVRPSSAMLTERRVRRASERERYNRCKQETYGREFHRSPPLIERASGENAIEDGHSRKNTDFVLIVSILAGRDFMPNGRLVSRQSGGRRIEEVAC